VKPLSGLHSEGICDQKYALGWDEYSDKHISLHTFSIVGIFEGTIVSNESRPVMSFVDAVILLNNSTQFQPRLLFMSNIISLRDSTTMKSISSILIITFKSIIIQV